MTYPATSRVISLTKAVRLDKKPFFLEILGAGVRGVTSVQSSRLGFVRYVFSRWERVARTVAGIEADDETCDNVSISKNKQQELFGGVPERCFTSFGMAAVVLSLELLRSLESSIFRLACAQCGPRPLSRFGRASVTSHFSMHSG